MASQFIGLHMRVVLREPPGYYLTGTVKGVEAGNSLTLTGVSVPGSNQLSPFATIDANNIADLSEVKHEHPPATYAAPPLQPVAVPVYTQPAPQSPFVDPAIMSIGRPPASSSTPTASATGRPPPKKNEANTPQLGQPGVLPIPSAKAIPKEKRPDQSHVDLTQRRKAQDNAHELDDDKTAELEAQQKSKKKTRARPTRKPKGPSVDDDGHPIDGTPGPTAQGTHGKGWRETPILQSTSSFQPFNSLKRNGKAGKVMADNGWASEDVTEEMGDFDFENNLAKFDKRTIFDQMRKDDQVDDSERLVTHNRKVKPGTAGGKNLHYTENVLDVPPNQTQNADFWNSEADVGGNEAERLSGREIRSGQSMRRTESKSGTKRSQSRKASGMAGPVVGGLPLSRVNSSQQNQQQSQSQQPGFYLLPSNRRLETISTLQMLNLENIAANELGFTEDLMAENAGRGLAEVALSALSDPAMKARYELAMASLPPDTSVNPSTVVILAGKNKSSVRALAAGRHLRNKGINVIVCLVGIEREKELLEDLRRQIQLYRHFGGKVMNKNDFFEYLRKTSASGGRAAWVSLIIDALLGLTVSFEELRIGDQATVYELMEWANRNEAFVLSVDIPSGIDPASGKIAIIDGGQLFVKPRYVVSLGAPKRGLLEAVTPSPNGEFAPFSNAAQDDHWRLFIADMGLGSAVWRKAGTKVRKGIDFDGKWVLEMEYRGAEIESEED